jgi:hypothetical protein
LAVPSGPPPVAQTDPLPALAVPVAIVHLALLLAHVALPALPSVQAVATTATVKTVAAAQDGTHA